MDKASTAILLKRFHEAQSQLVTQTADLPLGTLAEMVDSGAIDLEPSFQRRERWNSEKQSALIESFLLNVPVPPVYLAEEPSGKYTAIDGKQRLRAISDFIGGRLKLRKLERLTEAEGYSFAEFPEEIKNPLRLRPFLRVVTLLKQSDVALKYEVFLRLNRGGESLNNQEIRNVAFRGPLNTAIYELAKSPFLRKQLKISSESSPAFRNMDDAEYVLRFLTLFERSANFSGSFVREMDDFMRENQQSPPNIVVNYKNIFRKSLDACEKIWGNQAFKRPEKDGWRDQLIVGMYDAQMIAVATLLDASIATAINNRAAIIGKTKNLFEDKKFEQAVRTGTNTPQRIVYRIEKIREAVLSSVNE